MSDANEASSAFGSCCDAMKEVLAAQDFEPFIAAGDDGILYMSIGMMESTGEDANIVDHPVFFCPFCGTEVQTEEQVAAKSGETGES